MGVQWCEFREGGGCAEESEARAWGWVASAADSSRNSTGWAPSKTVVLKFKTSPSHYRTSPKPLHGVHQTRERTGAPFFEAVAQEGRGGMSTYEDSAYDDDAWLHTERHEKDAQAADADALFERRQLPPEWTRFAADAEDLSGWDDRERDASACMRRHQTPAFALVGTV